MGLIARLFGLAPAITRTAEVFVENRTKRAAQEHAEHLAAQGVLAAEYARAPRGWFDALVDGLNRLPRPALAMGTLGLFAFAMWDPVAFGIRMQGLSLVPEPLWWLLGAIVSFYFGARELHHLRSAPRGVAPEAVSRTVAAMDELRGLRRSGETAPLPVSASDVVAEGPAVPSLPQDPAPRALPATGAVGADANAALAEWRASRR